MICQSSEKTWLFEKKEYKKHKTQKYEASKLRIS